MAIIRLKRLLIGFSIGVILGAILASVAHAGDTSNLEAAWLLDEVSGTRFDETANNFDLTDNNTVTQLTGASCQFDECAEFDDANTEYLSSSNSGLDISGSEQSLTIGGWIYQNDLIDNELAAKQSSTGGFLLSAGGGEFLIRTSGGTGNANCGSPTANTWEHMVGVHNASSNEVVCYLNGTAGTPVAKTDGIDSTTNLFALGINHFGGAELNPHDGRMDEVFYFSRALSGSEITDLQDNGITAFISPAAAVFLPRVILMTSILGYSSSKTNYFGLVNNHRKKFNIKRPNWMKLFDIPEAFAATLQDKLDAIVEFDKRNTDQESYKSTNSKYKQKLPTVVEDMTYETHEYVGPKGVGYIQRVTKTENTKKFLLERHIGPETDRNINTEWTEIKEN